MKHKQSFSMKKLPPQAKQVFKGEIFDVYQWEQEMYDGLVRGPYLEKMYDTEMLNLFKIVKQIFDPNGVFNPHKKWVQQKSIL